MQFQQVSLAIDSRPSKNIRYSEQQFFSIDERYETIPEMQREQNSIKQEGKVQKQMMDIFEEKFNTQIQHQQDLFYSLPYEERKYHLMDKDTGQIYDMRNPQHSKYIQELIQSNSLNDTQHKLNAWEDFMKLSEKMNEHLLDYTELGDETSVENLLAGRGEFYINIDVRGLDDWTPLHFAANEGYPNLINILLNNEANIEAITKFQRTPLIVAVLQNQYECVQILIQRGANLNAQDKELNTSLHMASQQGNDRIIDLLLKHKANPKIKNQLNQNSLQVCCDVKSLQIYHKYGYEYEECSYDRTIVPGTNLLLKNSRFDHVAKLMDKTKGVKEQDQHLKQETKKICKFINLTKFVSVNLYDPQSKLGPNQFNFYQLLGKGAFGEVYLVDKIGQVPQKLYAMKILKKDRMMSQNLMRYVQTEKEVLSVMHHPFIVKLNYAFQTESKLFLVMDYCPGGDLSKLLDIKRKLTEDLAKIYVAEILLALECLHKNNIIFRDLKPENVVIDPDGHAMLTDFGLSKQGVSTEQLSKSFCGSPAYLPPEILSRMGHNRMADWYLLGALTYELLVGIPPYYANDREVLFDNIRRGPLKIPKSLSPESKSFIVALLNRDPQQRLGFERDGEEVREHPWLQEINWEKCYERQLAPPKPMEQDINTEPLKINFADMEDDKNKVNGWTFFEET